MTTVATLHDQYVDIDGVRVRHVVEPGPADGPTFVLVHGLGGSLENWSAVSPLLAKVGRVVSMDLGGFGLTRVPPKGASVPGNLRLLGRFLEKVTDRPAVVVGNSMGGWLTAQLAATQPAKVAGAVLVDPAIPPTPRGRPHRLVALAFGIYLVPGLADRFMESRESKMTTEQLVTETFKLVTSRLHQVDPAVIQQHMDNVERRKVQQPEGDACFLAAARSLLLQLGRRGSYDATMTKILQPTLLVHGDRDKLVNVVTARQLAARHPQWTYVEGSGIGHTPMLDYPEWTADTILDWLDAHPAVRRAASPR